MAGPFGWIEESRPLTSPRPAALLTVLALIVILVAVAAHLAGARDLGDSILRGRDSAGPRLTLLTGPAGLALRLSRPSATGWLSGIAAFALLFGMVAQGSTKDAVGSAGIDKDLARLGGHGSLVEIYLGLTFLVLALLIGLVAAGQVSAIRSEEADGRLENFAARPLSRTSWFAVRLSLSAALLIAAAAVAGLATWAGAASQHSGVGLGSLLLAGLNVAPPALFVLGLGALAFGAWPRGAPGVVYSYLAWSFLIEFLGGIVRASHWLMDTSVFFHLVPAPAASPDWTSAAIIAGLGLAGAMAGALLFRRRDLLGA